MGPFRVGQRIVLQASFKNQMGALTDPDTLLFQARVGKTGTVHQYVYPADCTRITQGVYQYRLQLDEAGTWFVGCVSTGAVESIAEATFPVLTSFFP